MSNTKNWLGRLVFLAAILNFGVAHAATMEIRSGQIVDGTLQTADYSDNSVTSAKVADNSITGTDILDNSITDTDIQGGIVNTAGTGLTKTGSTIDFNNADGSLLVNPDNAMVNRDAAGAITLGNGIKVNVDGTNVEISGNAVRLTAASAGAGLTGGAADNLAVGAGTGITVNANDVAVNSTTVLFKADFIFGETPNEAPDSVTTAFTVDNTPVANKYEVFLNGLQQRVTTDYTVSGSTFTFTTAPLTGDSIRINYLK